MAVAQGPGRHRRAGLRATADGRGLMPWLALRLLGLRSALGRAWEWATASASRMLAIALCASLAANLWLHHGKSKAIGERDAVIAGRASDNAICRKSLTTMQGAIDEQNSAIATLGKETAAKQKAAAIAVEAATARGKAAEGYAAKIDRERAVGVKGGPVCRSGAAVLNA